MEFNTLSIPTSILTEMRKHVSINLPYEACGLLGGLGGSVFVHVPVKNILKRTDEFRMDPDEQLYAFLLLEENKLDLLAIYHSHPNGPTHPSQKDLSNHHYPFSACIILDKKKPEWNIQAFWITEYTYTTIPIIEIN